MTLTKVDLDKIDRTLDIKFENQKGQLLEEIDKKLENLKSEFFERIDPILKEVTTSREERPLIENRLEALEEIHQQKGPHSLNN